MIRTDYQKYKQYAEDCITGKQVCCRYIKLAAQRYLSWFDRDDIEFRPDKADHIVNFIERLELFEGRWCGKKMILQPFQKFLLYGGYGWYYKGTDKRVIKHMILDIGRKQAKSTLGAAIALYHLIGEREYSGEIDIVANTRQQASILFRMVCEMSKRMDKSGRHIHRTINKVKYPKLESFCQVLASESGTLDGLGASLFIEDEMHAAKDTKLYDVLASSQGARYNPMSIICTSAGYNLSGPYYTEIRKSAIDMLNGLLDNDSLFVLIYTLDEGDDFRDINNWVKSMPGIGITVSEDYIIDRISNIKTQPSTEIDVITKNFNVWVQSAETWINDSYIMKSFRSVDLNKLSGEQYCLGGVDLASVSDLTAISIMFPPNSDRDYYPDKFIFKSWCFLPDESIESSPNRELYRKSINCKHLITTPGNVTDYNYITDLLLRINEKTPIDDIAYDSFNATQFAIDAEEKGLPLTPFAQGLGNFNRPTKEMERLILSGKVIIDANVITRWCFQNVILKTDYNENTKPMKSSKDQKIDIVISMIQALGSYLLSPRYCYNISGNK